MSEAASVGGNQLLVPLGSLLGARSICLVWDLGKEVSVLRCFTLRLS